MLYFTFAAFFAQVAITRRFVIPSDYFTYTSRCAQGICRHGGESTGCILSFIHDFGTVYLWDVRYGLFCVATSCVPSRWCLNVFSKALVSKAIVLPNLPFDEFQACSFQLWPAGEIAYAALLLVHGAHCYPLHHPVITGPRCLGLRCYRLFCGKKPGPCTCGRYSNHF